MIRKRIHHIGVLPKEECLPRGRQDSVRMCFETRRKLHGSGIDHIASRPTKSANSHSGKYYAGIEPSANLRANRGIS